MLISVVILRIYMNYHISILILSQHCMYHVWYVRIVIGQWICDYTGYFLINLLFITYMVNVHLLIVHGYLVGPSLLFILSLTLLKKFTNRADEHRLWWIIQTQKAKIESISILILMNETLKPNIFINLVNNLSSRSF